MQISNPVPSILSFARTNSPILTAVVGVSGATLAVVLAAKAGYEAGRKDEAWMWEHHRGEDYPKLTGKELVQSHWKKFIPTASTLSVTIGAIVAGHRINASRTAAVTAAYSLSEQAFGEYRARVVEKLGAKEEIELRKELKQDQEKRDQHRLQTLYIAEGDVTCMDAHSGRYFASTLQKIRTAQNDITEQIYDQMYATLSDFYDLIGLAPTSNSDDVGWNTDKPLRIKFGSGLTPEDKPCLVVNFINEPFQAHDSFN
jgi:hypothetical protein